MLRRKIGYFFKLTQTTSATVELGT